MELEQSCTNLSKETCKATSDTQMSPSSKTKCTEGARHILEILLQKQDLPLSAIVHKEGGSTTKSSQNDQEKEGCSYKANRSKGRKRKCEKIILNVESKKKRLSLSSDNEMYGSRAVVPALSSDEECSSDIDDCNTSQIEGAVKPAHSSDDEYGSNGNEYVTSQREEAAKPLFSSDEEFSSDSDRYITFQREGTVKPAHSSDEEYSSDSDSDIDKYIASLREGSGGGIEGACNPSVGAPPSDNEDNPPPILCASSASHKYKYDEMMPMEYGVAPPNIQELCTKISSPKYEDKNGGMIRKICGAAQPCDVGDITSVNIMAARPAPPGEKNEITLVDEKRDNFAKKLCPEKTEKDMDDIYEEIAIQLAAIADDCNVDFPESPKPKSPKKASKLEETTAVTEILKDASYDNFKKVVDTNVGNESGWRQLAMVFNLIKSAVSCAGYGTNLAGEVKEMSMQYFEDRFAGWVMDQGGWESAVIERT